jgi:hypothetical protein
MCVAAINNCACVCTSSPAQREGEHRGQSPSRSCVSTTKPTQPKPKPNHRGRCWVPYLYVLIWTIFVPPPLWIPAASTSNSVTYASPRFNKAAPATRAARGCTPHGCTTTSPPRRTRLSCRLSSPRPFLHARAESSSRLCTDSSPSSREKSSSSPWRNKLSPMSRSDCVTGGGGAQMSAARWRRWSLPRRS